MFVDTSNHTLLKPACKMTLIALDVINETKFKLKPTFQQIIINTNLNESNDMIEIFEHEKCRPMNWHPIPAE